MCQSDTLHKLSHSGTLQGHTKGIEKQLSVEILLRINLSNKIHKTSRMCREVVLKCESKTKQLTYA